MNHKIWDHTNVWYDQSLELIGEHNALYADWKQSSLEAERLAKVNGDLCDRIAELESVRVDSYTDHISGYQIFGSMENVKAVKKIFSDLSDTNREAMDENNRLDRELDEARQALAPIRVPFSDEAIEKMAEAARQAAGSDWPTAIRAALAAGGIEPCAVPEYAPQDVAFPPERASDEELVHIAIREYGADRQPETTTWQRIVAAVRSRVEVPLRAEIARLEREAKSNIEWQETMVLDLRSKDAELRAVTAERDAANERAEQAEAEAADLRCESSLIGELRTILGLQWGESITERCRELATLRAALDPAERESLVRALVEAKRQRDELASKFIAKNPSEPVYGGWHFEDGYKIVQNGEPSNNAGELPTPTDAQVEALARVLQRAYMKECYVDANECTPNTGYLAESRAAYAHIGRVPVGWELDVHPDQLELYKWVTMPDGGYTYAAQQAIDFCRSRIKPVYECKECRQWRNANDELVRRATAARAALEGE